MNETNRNPNNLTREQLEVGLNQMKEWYPEESEKIDKHRDVILSHILDGVEIPKDNPIWNEKATSTSKPEEVDSSAITPCIRQIAAFGGEALVFTATVAGAVTAGRFSKFIDRAIESMFFKSEKYVRGITPLLEAFNAAEGSVAKATSFAPIAKKFYDFGFFQVLFDTMKDNSHWYDWVIDGAIALAQIIIWVASEFIAAIAEIALIILSAVHLLFTGVEAIQICSE
ncbi:hypothetical protein A9Q87_13555 [Flavobacteriales bacterium 34_180_T64]|nr:hypothetical protein A9Q87_13555 [Flavobacteriales bacterium 34_180_T64]